MGKYKDLLINVGILAIGKCSTKVLSMLLVPLYTSILTTEEYGVFDLFQTSINLLLPILTLNISAAVLRYALDRSCDRSTVFSVGFFYSIVSGVIISLLLLLNHRFSWLPVLDRYAGIFLCAYLVDAMLNLATFFARGQEKMKDIAIAGVLGSLTMILCNLLFLLVLDLGFSGYFWATTLGLLVQTIYVTIRCRLWRYLRRSVMRDPIRREMLDYSIPLIPNSIVWCIYNAADRFTITAVWGLSANGIYSVASKIPSIMNMILTLFNKAWSVSAIKDFDPEDSDGFFSQTYTAYHLIMTVICSVLIATARILAAFLYSNDFFAAWQYVPFLLMAMLFSSVSGYLEGIFAAAKVSRICGRSTITGAAANIVLNLLLVPIAGPMAAAVVTTLSYWLVWMIQVHSVRRYVALRINLLRDHCVHFILLAQAILMLTVTTENLLLYLAEFGLTALIGVLYTQELKSVLCRFLHRK